MTRFLPLAFAAVFAAQGVLAADGAFRIERSTVLTSAGEYHLGKSTAVKSKPTNIQP